MTDWASGMKAECIDDEWLRLKRDVVSGARLPVTLPKIGDVLVVSSVYLCHSRAYICGGYDLSSPIVQFLRFAGHPHSWGFLGEAFRPLVERETDISIFEKMLGPSHAPNEKLKELMRSKAPWAPAELVE